MNIRFELESLLSYYALRDRLFTLSIDEFLADLQFVMKLSDPVSIHKLPKRQGRFRLACQVLGRSELDQHQHADHEHQQRADASYTSEEVESLFQPKAEIVEATDLFEELPTTPAIKTDICDKLSKCVNHPSHTYSIFARVAIIALRRLINTRREHHESVYVEQAKLIFKGSGTFGRMLYQIAKRSRRHRRHHHRSSDRDLAAEIASSFITGSDTDIWFHLPVRTNGTNRTGDGTDQCGDDIFTANIIKRRIHAEFMSQIRMVIADYDIDHHIQRLCAPFLPRSITLCGLEYPVQSYASQHAAIQVVPYTADLNARIRLRSQQKKSGLCTVEAEIDLVPEETRRRVSMIIGRVKKSFVLTRPKSINGSSFRFRCELMDIVMPLDTSVKHYDVDRQCTPLPFSILSSTCLR